MGWSNGGDVARPIVRAIRKNVKDEAAREKIYAALIDAFEDADCDTLYECKEIDPVFDRFFPDED